MFRDTFAVLLTGLALACGDDTTAPDRFIEGLASVDEVEVEVSSASRVEVTASGNLPDTCTEIAESQQAREGDTFRVTLATRRPADEVCAQVLVPFTETIVLSTMGSLAPGDYAVEVNGVRADFSIPPPP